MPSVVCVCFHLRLCLPGFESDGNGWNRGWHRNDWFQQTDAYWAILFLSEDFLRYLLHHSLHFLWVQTWNSFFFYPITQSLFWGTNMELFFYPITQSLPLRTNMELFFSPDYPISVVGYRHRILSFFTR